jgi:hypothetical protein
MRTLNGGRSMYQGKAWVAAALLAGAGFLAAGCGSNSNAASPPTAAVSKTTVPSGALPATDCTILRPIAGSAIAKLTPLASEPKTKAAAALKSYLAQLETAESHLASALGKSDLKPLITALQKSSTESPGTSEPAILAAITKLSTACV